jgi:hypothetical protein
MTDVQPLPAAHYERDYPVSAIVDALHILL